MKDRLAPWQIVIISAAVIVILISTIFGIKTIIGKNIQLEPEEGFSSSAEEAVGEAVESLEASESEENNKSETQSSQDEDKTENEEEKEPNTVIIYVVPSETKPKETDTVTNWEPETIPEIELIYDKELSEEVLSKLEEKYEDKVMVDPITDPKYFNDSLDRWGKQLYSLTEKMTSPTDQGILFAKQYKEPTAEAIVSDWKSGSILMPDYALYQFNICVYRAPNNWICLLCSIG